MFQITLNLQKAPVYQCLVFDMVVKSSYIYKVSGSFSFEMYVMELKVKRWHKSTARKHLYGSSASELNPKHTNQVY